MRCFFLFFLIFSNVVCGDSDYSDILVSLEKVWLEQKKMRGRVQNLTKFLEGI